MKFEKLEMQCNEKRSADGHLNGRNRSGKAFCISTHRFSTVGQMDNKAVPSRRNVQMQLRNPP